MTPGYTRYAPLGDPPAFANDAGWIVVSGRSFIAALAAGAPAGVIDELWRLARHEAATVEAVVGAIPLAGATAVRSFAVVSVPVETTSVDGRTVTAVVRGTVSIDVVSVGGARRFWAAGVQPWVLADFRSVTGFVIGDEDQPAEVAVRPSADALPLGEGVVAAKRFFWSQQEFTSADADAGDRAEVDSAQGAPAAVAQEGSGAPAATTTGFSALEETIIRGRPEQTVTVTDDDTVLHGRAGVAPKPAPAWEAAPAPITQTPAPAPTEPAAPEPVALEPTIAEPTTPEPVVAAPARFRFRLVPGEPFELDAPTFFGRKPRAPGVVSGVVPRMVEVASPRQQVSGTHLRVEQLGSSVVVTDLRSTNGTVVSGPGIPSIRLRPGESRVVLAGTTIDIGDGNIIEIVPPHES